MAHNKPIIMNYEIAHKEMFSHAMDFYGLEELPGDDDNPQILEFFDYIGHEWVKSEDTAWCSAFINYLAKKTGYEYSGKLDARSWMQVGSPIITPTVGDVVVLWRVHPNDWRGHVGLFVRDDDKYVWVLGGNQNNMVNIKPYPKQSPSYGLLGYRMLEKI